MGENGAQEILHRLHIPWPDANEGKLHEAAVQWRRLGKVVDSAAVMADREVKAVVMSNRGSAINAFEDYWQGYGERGTGLMARLTQACEAMAKGCDEYADAVAKAKHKIELAAIEVGATLAVGAVGAFVSFGATEAMATSIAVWLTRVAGEAISTLVSFAITAGSNVFAWTLSGAFETALTQATLNSLKVAMGEDLPGAGEELKALATGIVSSNIGGPLGKAAGAGAGEIAEPFRKSAQMVRASDPELAAAFDGMADAAANGAVSKIGQGVSTAAANQLITRQELDAKGLAEALVKSGIGHKLGTVRDG